LRSYFQKGGRLGSRLGAPGAAQRRCTTTELLALGETGKQSFSVRRATLIGYNPARHKNALSTPITPQGTEALDASALSYYSH